MKKALITAIVLVALAAVAFAVLHSGGKDEQSGPATVAASRETLVEKALATGDIVPRHEIAVKSKISGTVARLFVEEGSWIEAGDRLLEVRPEPTPLEYARAKRTLEMRVLVEDRRQVDQRRTEGLLDRGMASQADFDKAREAYDQAVLQRQMAEEELALLDEGRAVVAGRSVETVVTSPISGHVLQLNVDVGDPVVPLTSYQPGTELLRLADMDDLLFRGTVDEIDVGKIRQGLPVELKVGAYPDSLVRGTLARIALKSEKRESATVFEVEVDITEVPEALLLRAGYSANADIIVQRVHDVVTLPERVLVFRHDSTFVRLPAPSPQRSVGERPIEIGMSDGIRVEVVSGLDSGDVVLDKETREIE